MKQFSITVILFLLWSGVLLASPIPTSSFETSPIIRIDPPFWWVGMKSQNLQLCIYGKNIAAFNITSNSDNFVIKKINKVENPNYLFLDVLIPTTAAGALELKFSDATHTYMHTYRLKERDKSAGRVAAFSTADLVYLIMPDRFANGDRRNDIVPNTNDSVIERDSIFYRHGGDIRGVMDHLDYIKELGATAIWLTPVQENNQPKESYHGYAITDHYKIDPRMGDMEWYSGYVKAAHAKGLKCIMDMVYNHVGLQHWFIRDLPMRDWIHQHDTFTKTNYRALTLIDPYASKWDKNLMRNGWFARHMPDLNQQNPYLAQYLIQNSIWWIESTGIDGYRIDTYTYSDADFMQELMKRIMQEYPSFNAVGELWDHNVAVESYFQQQPKVKGVPDSHLPGLTDFQLYNAINEALTKQMGWTEGLSRIYYTLAQDYLYSQPSANLTFLDNHDLSRFYSVVGEDINKWKMGIAFLLTMRGIPSIYYGTEILMKNYANPDGKVREDFPGGWKGDRVNKFNAMGRTDKENEAFSYIRKLANFRKECTALQSGTLTQFVPENDSYVYFREDTKKTLMMVLHYSEKPHTLNLARFNEKLVGYKKMKEIMTDTDIAIPTALQLRPNEVRVYELMK